MTKEEFDASVDSQFAELHKMVRMVHLFTQRPYYVHDKESMNVVMGMLVQGVTNVHATVKIGRTL